VFFFNAFELGAESANQVLSNKALRSIAEVFSTMHWIVLMSTHASVLVDSVGPPSAEVCRTVASFP
jgi:hypothetical protein